MTNPTTINKYDSMAPNYKKIILVYINNITYISHMFNLNNITMKDKIKSNWIDKANALVYQFKTNEDNALFVHVSKQVGTVKTYIYCGGNVVIGKKGFSFKTYGLQRKPTLLYIYWQDLQPV